MSDTATVPAVVDPNADLAGVRMPDAPSPFRKRDYTPGLGYTHHLSGVPVPNVAELSMRQLAYLYHHPEHPLAQMVEAECSQGCGRRYEVRRGFAGVTACDECRAKVLREESMKKAKGFWEKLCPPSFRDTDKTHPDFPKAQYAATKSYAGDTSLFLYGPTRKGKTRLGVWLLKRCLVRYSKSVAILWPEQLKAVKANNVNRLEWVTQWGSSDLLLLDDPLLSGAQDERISDALKDLIDYRMRYKRQNLITSQIGGDGYREQLKKFGDPTQADVERVEALLARIIEICQVVPFAEATPQVGEQPF